MELIINNIAKVKNAKINLDGITVIVGNNDTGKSTIGKVLFALFNSLNNIQKKLKDEKNETFLRAFISVFRELLPNDSERPFHFKNTSKYKFVGSKILNILEQQKDNEESLLKSIIKVLKTEFANLLSENDYIFVEISQKVLSEYNRINNIPDKSALLTIISRYFSSVFDNQVGYLGKHLDFQSSTQIIIKNKSIELSFEDDICYKIEYELDITKKAIFIDNPFVLDNLLESELGAYVDKYLQFLLLKPRNTVLEQGAYDFVNINDKLLNIDLILNEIIHGSVIETDSDFVLQKDELSEDIHLQNLSTGLKSFILIKLLLQKQILEEKDVLILDEPEIHLHPEWQLKYAEAIVLLQKAFDLNIVITTHSSTFLEAIDLFSKKHSNKQVCNYYLSKVDNSSGLSTFEDVTDSLDKVYKSLVTPTIALMRLREELEKDDND